MLYYIVLLVFLTFNFFHVMSIFICTGKSLINVVVSGLNYEL